MKVNRELACLSVLIHNSAMRPLKRFAVGTIGFLFLMLCALPWYAYRTFKDLGINIKPPSQDQLYRDAVDERLTKLNNRLADQDRALAAMQKNPHDPKLINVFTNTAVLVELEAGVIQDIPATPRYREYDSRLESACQSLIVATQNFILSVEQSDPEKSQIANTHYQLFLGQMRKLRDERSQIGWSD